MYTHDTEMLFPLRAVIALRSLRGPVWQALIELVLACPENHPDALAFGLMMIRLNGCLSCHADSYRALRGCTACAHYNIARHKGGDEDLIALWEAARADIERWQATGMPPTD